MSRVKRVCSAIALMGVAMGAVSVRADHGAITLAVIMTNVATDPAANQIQVYDVSSHALLQTLSTQGKGGVGGNGGGVKQYRGALVAVVNNGSNTVAIFKREHDRLKFDQLVSTSSAPVSIDFANDHMYVAGATTVDSFKIHGNDVGWLDGTTWLQLATGGAPSAGSTAQVGVVDERHLLVTLKADPDPGTVDVVQLHDGAVTGAPPTAVSAPAGTLTPFGFSVYPDGTAVITLAHSNQDGLFRDGAFTAVTSAGQTAPCWTTRAGRYVFTVNTASRTISRLVGTGNHVFVDSPVAATIATGGAPTDVDANDGVLGVIDHVAGQSHVSLFTYNEFGELALSGVPITLGIADPNGIAILTPNRDEN